MTSHTMMINAVLHRDPYEPRSKRLKADIERVGATSLNRPPLAAYPRGRAWNGSDQNVLSGGGASLGVKDINDALHEAVSSFVVRNTSGVKDAITPLTPQDSPPIRHSPALEDFGASDPPRPFDEAYLSTPSRSQPPCSVNSAPSRFDEPAQTSSPKSFPRWFSLRPSDMTNSLSSSKEYTSPYSNFPAPDRSSTAENLSQSDVDPRDNMPDEKTKKDNRERKQRWRANNSDKNKDNDLRCRVYKLAKAKFGDETSPAAQAFIQSEFQRRRSRRQVRQQHRTTAAGALPQFAVSLAPTNPSTSVSNSIAPDTTNHAQRATDAGGSWVENNASHDTEGAARTPEDSFLTDGGTNNEAAPAAHSDGIVQAINNVLATLGDLANPRPYQSPYVKPPTTRQDEVSTTQPASNGGAPRSSNSQEAPISMAQIDAFLALANGGSLSDDEDEDEDDDETISEPSSEKEGPEESGSGARDVVDRDTEMETFADNLVDQLASNRAGGSVGVPASPTAAYAEEAANEQATRVRNDLPNAGLVVNAVVPAAQGEALSRLYGYMAHQATPAPTPRRPSVVMETPSPAARPASQGAENATSAGNSPRPGIFRTPAARRAAVRMREQADKLNARQGSAAAAGVEAAGAEAGGEGPEKPPDKQEKKVRSFGFPPVAGAQGGAARKE